MRLECRISVQVLFYLGEVLRGTINVSLQNLVELLYRVEHMNTNTSVLMCRLQDPIIPASEMTLWHLVFQ